MLFNSFSFLIFFPIVTVVYYIVPKKWQWGWLLAASFYFYLSWNIEMTLLLSCSIVFTYFTALWIEKRKTSRYGNIKIVMAVSLIVNLGVLFFFKYFDFATQISNWCFSRIGWSFSIPTFDLMMPIGISFYTFQVLGYIIDVYRGTVAAEKNILRYALFVSFFPQIVSGPIGRASSLFPQLFEQRDFQSTRVTQGLILMMWGYFQKVVVADRLGIFVDTVYRDSSVYSGGYIWLATIFFAFQIYCDFSSYSNLARGCARVVGIDLIRNFDSPYFARSIREFWHRWHISLSTWFRDYLYFPLGGSKKGKWRTYCNLMIVFLVSGLWHGARVSYLVWGFLHGMYQIIGKILSPLKQKICRKFRFKQTAFGYHFFQTVITFTLVTFAWIFFRADGVTEAFSIIHNMMTFNPWVWTDGTMFTLGLDIYNMIVVLFGILAIVGVDYYQWKGNHLEVELVKQPVAFRWLVYITGTVIILFLGIYGPAFGEAQFIYAQF